MTRRFAVVHEAEADFQTATDLADRVLVEAASWLDNESVVYQREWVSQDPGGRRLTWKAMRRLAEAAGIEAEGFFDGRPGLADARAARRAILYLRAACPELDGIILVRDRDDQEERRDGLDQARNEHHGHMLVVLGLAVVEREAWVISGFEPQDGEETTRLSTERQTLGFNPCERSHELTACKDDTAKRSPKRVLRALTQDDRDREAHCWQVTPLSTLEQRGAENGLAAYLAEVRQHLAPLIGS